MTFGKTAIVYEAEVSPCFSLWVLSLNKDKELKWGFANLLASAEIENGVCTYAFAPHLRLKLYNPRVYAKLNLHLQNQFKIQYALVLWEICFDYFDRDREKGQTPFIPLETFRELMGIEADEYRTFKALNQTLIKPAVKEINEVTDYFVEAEHKRLGRKVAELKYYITKVKQLPVQESLFPDIENLPPVAVELVQAAIDRKEALKIAAAEWDFVNPEKIPPPGTYPDFMAYIAEKIEISRHAAEVKNRGGFIVDAIRENYQDPAVQKARELRAEKVREKELEDLTAEFKVKRDNILRHAVHANPELVEKAAEKIQSYMIRERLIEYDSVIEVYQRGGMVKAEIDGILAQMNSVKSCSHQLLRRMRIKRRESSQMVGSDETSQTPSMTETLTARQTAAIVRVFREGTDTRKDLPRNASAFFYR